MRNKQNQQIKKIPYYIICFRLILIPIIIILGFTKHFLPIMILLIFIILSDFLDDYIAKKWLVQSKKKEEVDVFCEKLLFISLFISFLFRFKICVIPLLLEIGIGLTNLYYYRKTEKFKILNIGKIKTVILFISTIITFFTIFKFMPIRIFNASISMVINIQVLTLIYYYIDYRNQQYEEKQQELQKTRKKRMEDLEDKTIMLDKIEDLLKDYEKKDIL